LLPFVLMMFRFGDANLACPEDQVARAGERRHQYSVPGRAAVEEEELGMAVRWLQIWTLVLDEAVTNRSRPVMRWRSVQPHPFRPDHLPPEAAPPPQHPSTIRVGCSP
jgi:hypothetical protein